MKTSEKFQIFLIECVIVAAVLVAALIAGKVALDFLSYLPERIIQALS